MLRDFRKCRGPTFGNFFTNIFKLGFVKVGKRAKKYGFDIGEAASTHWG